MEVRGTDLQKGSVMKVGDKAGFRSEVTFRDLEVGGRVVVEGKAVEITYVETNGNWVTAGVILHNAHGASYHGHIKATKNKPVTIEKTGVVESIVPLHPLDGEGNLISIETERGYIQGVGPMLVVNTLVHEDKVFAA